MNFISNISQVDRGRPKRASKASKRFWPKIISIWKRFQKKVRNCALLNKSPGGAELLTPQTILSAKRSTLDTYGAVGKNLKGFEQLSPILEHDQVGEMVFWKRIWRIWIRISTDQHFKGTDSECRMVLEHQQCKTIHHEPFWTAGGNWITISLQFSDFRFGLWVCIY